MRTAASERPSFGGRDEHIINSLQSDPVHVFRLLLYLESHGLTVLVLHRIWMVFALWLWQPEVLGA